MEKKKVFFVKLGLELVIVFIGMTLAIFVNNYQNVKDEQKARLIFFETFLKELNNFENSTDILIKKIDTYLNEFSKEMDQKKRPKLKSIDFSFFSNTLIIGSAFTEDNFSAIGSKFLSSISRGTSLIKVINQKIQNYKRNTAQLLYFQEYKSDRFYDANNQLRSEYQWYINDLKEIVDHLKKFSEMIKKGALPETKQLIKANQL